MRALPKELRERPCVGPLRHPCALRALPAAAAALLLTGCGSASPAGPCSPLAEPRPLAEEVPESSGIVPASEPGLYWTHNDSGGEPQLFAVDEDGELRATIPVEGADNLDWEALAAGPCPHQDRCLYVADTGDNRLERDTVVVYRVPEPSPDGGEAEPGRLRADSLPVIFPHGPRDVEALFTLPSDAGSPWLHLVTKGRAGAIEQYRHPGPLQPGETVELERLSRMSGGRPLLPRMVTGAAATADGGLVAVRTYGELRFHTPDERGVLPREPVDRVSLRPLREPQGEAVAFEAAEDLLVLTSEAGPGGGSGTLSRLRCRLPGPDPPSPRPGR